MSFEEMYENRMKYIDDLFISVHCSIDKMPKFGIDENDIEKIYKKGKLYISKCEKPNKISISLYNGKKRTTQVIVVRFGYDHVRVVTVWEQKGKL
jgi:hypothetical protein